MNEIKNILSSNEKVIWEGKPKFAPYFISQLTCAGCFSLIFLIIALFAAAGGELGPSILFFVLGFVFIISPLISYLYYKKIYYAITDKRIILQSGIIGTDFNSVDFDKIQSMNVSVGIIDKLFGGNTGTISVFSGLITSTGQGGSVSVPHSLIFVEDAYDVYEKLKKVSHDVKTDIEYPNDLRPNKNSGYNTGYTPSNK